MMDENRIDWVEDLKTIHMQPGDVLVIKASNKLSLPEEAHIKEIIFKIFPHHKLLILYPGVELGVISGEVKVEGSEHA